MEGNFKHDTGGSPVTTQGVCKRGNGSYIFSASQYEQIVQAAVDVDKKVG